MMYARTAVVVAFAITLAFAMCLVGGVTVAAGQCPNEQFRTGRSAGLPDCRAYELVTPEDLGRTQDLLFEEGLDHAFVSSDGDHLALEAEGAFFEPGVSAHGTQAVFSRTAAGWAMTAVAEPQMAKDAIKLELFGPELSQVGLASVDALANADGTFRVGPAGGPYATLADVPESAVNTTIFVGANTGTPAVSGLAHIVLASSDHELLSPGPEDGVAEGTTPGRVNLYEWTDGRLRLVNVNSRGELLNRCGAALGYSEGSGNALGAISADGSTVFFTSPEAPHESGCLEPALYMRVDGRETVDVTEPEGISVSAVERKRVDYDGASTDGSRVFFTTVTALTPGAETEPGYKLYEYDREMPEGRRLKLVASEVTSVERQVIDPGVLVSGDGSAVYYDSKSTIEERGRRVAVFGIWRYDTVTGKASFVAVPQETQTAIEPWSVTPNGDFFLFAAGHERGRGIEVVGPNGLEVESRGAGNEQLYRYDAATGQVMCVSCGNGVAPSKGHVREAESLYGYFDFPDIPPSALSVSEDGRRVLFQTSARLVSQDTNESTAEEESQGRLGVGVDVYEWEADGTEEEPGAFCEATNGCTHLISAGEAVGPERFLGASANGDDVFFTSAAQLVPQATPEFTNVYDARVGGGFSSLPPSVECTSCQGAGSSTPSFGTSASRTFVGAGNPSHSATTTTTHTTTRLNRAKKLARALRACRRMRRMRARASCRARAQHAYEIKG